MKKLALSLCILVGLGAVSPVLAAETGVVTVPAMVDAGAQEAAGSAAAPSAAGPSTLKPSDAIHDPTTEPGAAWSDAKAARSMGWPALIGFALVMLSLLVGKLGKGVPSLAWLGKGYWALGIGAAGAIGAAAYNAAADGGNPYAVLMAAGMALVAYWQSHRG